MMPERPFVVVLVLWVIVYFYLGGFSGLFLTEKSRKKYVDSIRLGHPFIKFISPVAQILSIEVTNVFGVGIILISCLLMGLVIFLDIHTAYSDFLTVIIVMSNLLIQLAAIISLFKLKKSRRADAIYKGYYQAFAATYLVGCPAIVIRMLFPIVIILHFIVLFKYLS